MTSSPPQASPSVRARALAVHGLTAAGVVPAFLAALEIASADCDPRRVFGWLIVAVLIDAVDGPLARRWHVKTVAPSIDGRKIDDIVDYLTFTFLPLLLVWRMGWVPEPRIVFVVPPLIASLFGFAHVGAKEEDAGFFRGFPSYWNVVAFYAGLLATAGARPAVGALLLVLAVVTLLPLRFVYPNLAPQPWRAPLLGGALLWTAILATMLPDYPHPPGWLVALSLAYPVFYVASSLHLARR